MVGLGLGIAPFAVVQNCRNYGGATSASYVTCLGSYPITGAPQSATILGDDAYSSTPVKGRLNFSNLNQGLYPHHIFTLVDSQPWVTAGTPGYRPAASANDTWIGVDSPPGQWNQAQLAMGAPKYVDFYINNVGDNNSYLERLSASQKIFNVPAQFNSGATVSGNLVLPQGSGYVPAAGGIGLDTAAGLPVVSLGGATHQVAFTSSNISGQAGTALALAQTPTQCSGSFATGVQANGNANCTTPNVIQLAETAQPAGIPNWGVFWFDAATHSPRVIENNGQPVQLGLTNLFNSDPGGDAADNLEERNGTAAQNLRVYSSYQNNTTWDRISLGSEMAGGTSYNVLRSEDATNGNALSLGMHIGPGIKWFFSSDGTFKPNPDNSYDVGTDSGQAVRSVFAKTSFNIYSTGRQDFEFLNDPTAGTTLNQLAVYNSAATGVQTAATSSTDGVVGIVSGSAGTSNKAIITWAGMAACNFDAASPIAGNYVVASTTQAGRCHDSGSTSRPTGVQVIGRIEGGSVRVNLAAPSGGSGGGAVASVFGRTGAVVATTGDYSVAQVTGAAADSAVVHLAGAETISGSKTFSTDLTLSGNLNVAGNINQTSSSPTQWSGKKWTGTTVTVPSGMDFSLGVGSDNSFKCQLASGSSCMPGGGGGVTSVFGRTGAVVAQSGDYTATQVGLGNVTNDAQTKAAVVPNTAPGAGQILIGNSGGTAYAAQAVTGDATITSAGAVTVAKVNGGAIPGGATLVGTNSGGQLIAQSGTISNNTTGTAANLSGTAVLPNGTAAATQSAGDNSTKLATTAYVKNESYFSWSCPVAGSTAVAQNCNWTLPAGLTITGFDFAANTAPVGCTTYPVVQVWDGTAVAEVGSYSITLASGANFYTQVTGSANVASGHQLRIKVTTAASGCGTNAGGMVATVSYQMQN